MVLDVISISVGLFFGLLAIYFYRRGKIYPTRLSFYLLDMVQITDPKDKKFENLHISYEKQEINEGILYFKGLFVNKGDADAELNCEDKEKRLRICLPLGCSWLSLHQTERSEGLDVRFSIDPDERNVAYVNSDLFRKQEMATFEGFIVGDISSFSGSVKSIEIKHRLKGFASVDVERLSASEEKEQKSARMFFGIMSLLIAFFIGLLISQSRHDVPINFVKPAEDSAIIYSAKGCPNDTIEVIPRDKLITLEKQYYSVSDFNDQFEVCVRESKGDTVGRIILISLGVLVSIAVLAFACYHYFAGIKKRRVFEKYEVLLHLKTS